MSITPHICVRGAERAAAFYRDAFGAEEISRVPTPDGRLMSLRLRMDDGDVHLADEFPELGVLAPPSIGGTAVVLSLDVADAEAVFARAIAAGAEVRQPLQDAFWVIGTVSSRTPSGTAGTSISTCATCPTKRSWPRRPELSRELRHRLRGHRLGRTLCLTGIPSRPNRSAIRALLKVHMPSPRGPRTPRGTSPSRSRGPAKHRSNAGDEPARDTAVILRAFDQPSSNAPNRSAAWRPTPGCTRWADGERCATGCC
jgi:PhnB protein